MLFKIVCIILLLGILIAAILILTILVRNLIRDFKKDVVAQVQEGILPILQEMHEMKDHASTEVLEELKNMEENGLIPLARRVHELQGAVYEIGDELFRRVVGEGGPNSSYMMGHYNTGHYMNRDMASGPDPSGISRDPGHSIHVFKNGNWELQEDFSKVGYEAGRPSMKGNYEGQVVRTISGPAPEAK